MKKTIRLTETDLGRIVKRIISEEMKEMMDVSSDSEHYQSRKKMKEVPHEELSMAVQFALRFCEGKENLPDCQKIRRMYSKYNLWA